MVIFGWEEGFGEPRFWFPGIVLLVWDGCCKFGAWATSVGSWPCVIGWFLCVCLPEENNSIFGSVGRSGTCWLSTLGSRGTPGTESWDGTGIVGKSEKGSEIWVSCFKDLLLSFGSVDLVKFVAVFDFWGISGDGNTLLVGVGDGDSEGSNFGVWEASGVFTVEVSLLLKKGRDSHPLVHRENILNIAVNKSLRIGNYKKPNLK